MALLSVSRAAAGAAALALLAGGCEFVHPPTFVPGDENQLLVYSVLEAGSDSAVVLVARVGTPASVLGVPGARVRIAGPGGEAVLAEVTGQPRPAPCGAGDVAEGTAAGCYAAAIPGGIVAGREYTLEVDMPGGERVRGRTVVVAPPVVQSPVERLRMQGDTTPHSLRSRERVTVRWSAQDRVGLRAWAERVWGPDGEGGECGVILLRPEEEWEVPVVDSVDVQVEAAGCMSPNRTAPLRPDSVQVVLAVTAFDPGYWEYIQYRENGIPQEYASVGLEGAYGAFASVAAGTRRVVLVKP